MFKDAFYTIREISSNGNNHTVFINLNTEHSIYKGHFPEQPVVPGVCTLQIIKECVAEILKKNVRYATITNCKFSSLLLPTQEPIELSIELSEGDICHATVSLVGETVLKLKANFVEI